MRDKMNSYYAVPEPVPSPLLHKSTELKVNITYSFEHGCGSEW